jgi:hypothetical protein
MIERFSTGNSGVARRGSCKSDREEEWMLKRLLENPRAVCAIFAPDKLVQIDRWSYWTDFCRCAFFSLLLLVSAIRLLLLIPGDMLIETRRIKLLEQQRKIECMEQFREIGCGMEENKECEELRKCWEDLDEDELKITYFGFFWELLNGFFYFLTPKAAGVLGVVSAVFLYVNLLSK